MLPTFIIIAGWVIGVIFVCISAIVGYIIYIDYQFRKKLKDNNFYE